MNAKFTALLAGLFLLLSTSVPTAVAEQLGSLEYLLDETGTYSLEQVVALPQQHWAEVQEEKLSAGYDQRPYWVRASIPNSEERRLLHIAYPLLDSIHVYFVQQGELVSFYELGDHLPFSARPIVHEEFVVDIPSQSHLTLYLRVQTTSALNVPVYITSEKALHATHAKSQMGFGIYFGVLICMVLYNIFGYIVIRDTSVFSYSVFVIVVGLMTASLTGVGFHYVWPNNIWLQEHALVLFGSLSFTFAAIFIHQMLEIKEYSKAYSKGLWLVGISSGALALISVFLPYHTAIRLLLILSSVSTVFIAVLAIDMWRRGSIYARIFACAWAAFLLAVFLNSLGYLGILDTKFMQRYAIMAGSGIEVLVLSWVLTLRFSNERLQKLSAQQEALRKAKEAQEAQRQLNEELEERVEERTFELGIALRELQQVNQELERKSSEDDLTKLYNRRHFDRLLTSEFRRAWRSEQPLALIMLDIDFFKPINDSHGHMIGDQILRGLSKRLKQVAKRSGDSVFRFGGEEFALLLTNTEKKQAEVVADNIRAAINGSPFPTDAGDIAITVSMGVAVATNEEFEVPEQLLKAADDALYQAKNRGRDQIVCADTA
ncbi:hypothetical protein CWE15_08565 [Aliidiomarina taiwanensis]|uniref:diguanylate cyclase n=1 Tax=Aliidiomarina taiwanensis TaxID=946228 RepID=A0A432X0X7_9GAMM|nr:diguanylate cyclase [Aliidiomarina taiwanensis]RUO39802.1 hypothetical protein CWE15_08565 [Aliidiomarina taiwanensis]